MAWKENGLGSLLFLLMGVLCVSDSRLVLTVGVIHGIDALPGEQTEEVRYHGLQCSSVWLHVDPREQYDLFRAVQYFNGNKSIDAIILLTLGPYKLTTEQILNAVSKPVLRWMMSPSKITEVVKPDICTDEPIVQSTSSPFKGEPFCLDISNDNAPNVNAYSVINGPRIVSSLVKMLKWKSVFILYENATETEASRVLDLFSVDGVLCSLFNVDRLINVTTTLRQAYDAMLRTSESTINFVVLSGLHGAKRILKTANGFDSNNVVRKTALRQVSQWLMVVYGATPSTTHVLRYCADDMDNVATIALPEYTEADDQKLVESFSGILYELKIEQANASDDMLRDKALSLLQKRLNTLSWLPGQCKAIKIETLMWSGKGQRAFITVGHVHLDGNVSLDSKMFPNTNNGFNGRSFLVSTLPYRPFVMNHTLNGTRQYEGFCMDLLLALSVSLNFTYTIIEPADRNWGTTVNGSWNGLIGQLEREEVDLVVAPISIQPEREIVMDFSYPYYYSYTGVIVKQPDQDARKWRTLIDPFRWEVLLTICASLPVITFLVYIMEKFNPYYDVTENSESREINGGLNTYADALWYMYGALLCQGGVHLPDSTAGRTIVSFWWIFSITIVGIYSGNLIAFLTVTKNEPPFQTLEEMVSMKGDYRWGTLGGTYWEVLFQTSKKEVFQRIGEGMNEFKQTDPDVLAKKPSIHLNKVKQGGYAWIGDKTTIELTLANECDLLAMKKEFLPLKYSIGLPNNSPHTKRFSDELLAIHESGLLQIWKQKWWPKANLCKDSSTTKAKPIEVKDVQSAFYLIGVGLLFASLSFFVELILHYFKKKRTRQNSLQENGVLGQTVIEYCSNNNEVKLKTYI